MANTFKDISQFTLKSAATGTEEFQVSATEKVTAQQIADLATRGLSIITVTNFNTRTWTGGKSASEMVEGEIQAFISAANTTGAPSNSAYRGFVQKVSGNSTSYILRYYAWSGDVSVTGIYIGFSMYVGNCSWKSLTFDQSRETVIEVGDFTTINELWPASVEQTPGNVVSFYTGTEVYSQPAASETKYVGFVILDTDFANTKTATVIAYGQNTGRQYIGKLEYEAQSIDWRPLTYASRLTDAVKVTAFTESSLSSLLSSWKTGDVVPFTTGSVIASADNQFPESGIFNGFISMGSNEGDYFQIFAFKTGSPNAYIGACIGSTTRWTQIGGSSSNPIVVADAENVGKVVAAYKGFEGSNKYGVSVPIYIEATSNIYEELPAIMNQSFTKDESTICGYAQYVYDGGDYYHIGLSLLIYPSSGDRPKYRAELVVNNSGEVVSSSLTPIGSARAPIPGFTKITSLAGQTDYSLAKGSMGVINFSTEVNANTIMFIEAEVRSSAAISADVRSVCIPVSFFNPKQGATLMDLNTRTLASGTNIAQVRLNVASVVTGANGVQGLNCVVTSNNLANSSDILRIKAVYANI